MVAKPRFMITHLGGKHKLSGLSVNIAIFDIPATNFLPGAVSSVPSVVHDPDNVLQLFKNQRLIAWAKT